MPPQVISQSDGDDVREFVTEVVPALVKVVVLMWCGVVGGGVVWLVDSGGGGVVWLVDSGGGGVVGE